MIAASVVLLCLAAVAESRVSFIFSQVLDSDDYIHGGLTFQCEAGCRVYSPTADDNFIIYDNTGRSYYSLKDLSELKFGDYYELPARSLPYYLKNTEYVGSAFFTLYVIEKGAKNYDTKVLYLTDETTQVDIRHEPLLTVMSSTGTIYFSNFEGDFSDALPTVHATGFDSLSMCRPVYKARSAASLANTSFPVHSPIATVDFTNSFGGKSVRVSGDPNGPISTGIDTTSIFSSPGYVGCGKDRYSWPDKRLDGFDTSFTVQSYNGLTVHVDGDYSIYTESNEVTLNVSHIEETLNGTDHSYVLDYNPIRRKSPVQIGVNWMRQTWAPDGLWYSPDTFALQIDVISKPAKRVTTTTQPTVQHTIQAATSTQTPSDNLETTEGSTTDTEKSEDIAQTTSITDEKEDKTTKSGEHGESTTSSGRSLTITSSLLVFAQFVIVN